MIQLKPRHDVADSVDAFDVGLAALIGQDETPVDGDTCLFIAQTFGDRAPSDGHQQQICLDGLAGLQGHAHDITGLGDAGKLHVCLEVDLALAEGSLKLLGDCRVLGRHQAGESLDDGHLGAEGLEDGSELDSYDAATQDHDTRRNVVEKERLLAGHDPARDLQAGQ